jgi:hypothetical protein
MMNSTVWIADSVGKGGVNAPADVQRVNELLNSIGLLESTFANDQARDDALTRFQEIWGLHGRHGQYDGKVERDGTTLRKLNETASPHRLTYRGQKKIRSGGYLISYTPHAPPPPYRVLLGESPEPMESIDVTDAISYDVITATNLPALLKLIDRKQRWGGNLNPRLFIVLDRKLVSASDPIAIPCPVAPHRSTLLPLSDKGPGMTYQGLYPKAYWGRWLEDVPGFDGSFFAVGYDPGDPKGHARFETDRSHRGFDCITYAGTVSGAPPNVMHTGDELAAWFDPPLIQCSVQKTTPSGVAEQVKLEEADWGDVATYFSVQTAGHFLMWSSGHVVIVANGIVHEFTNLGGGYRETAVQDWLKASHNEHPKLSVRQFPSKLPRAT